MTERDVLGRRIPSSGIIHTVLLHRQDLRLVLRTFCLVYGDLDRKRSLYNLKRNLQTNTLVFTKFKMIERPS
jgi:hypothetical protein